VGYQVKEVSPTPNPNAVKLILDRQITERPTSFLGAESAKDHLLASRLFEIVGVNSVFMLGDFVTINKSSDARWADITPKVKKVLKGFATD
jgi:NAD(P)H-flavin reductase